MEETKVETTVETAEEETQPVVQKQNKGEAFREYFTARRIVYIATFAVLALALRFFQFPILNALPILQLDFSDVFIMISAYALGPVAGIITCVFKELLYGIITGSSTSFVGEFANIIISIPFILIPAIIYKKHKGIKSVIVWLVVACVVRVLWSIPVNWFLSFPAYLGFNWKLGMATFVKVWYWATLFNLIKTVALAVVVMLLYKSVSRLINLINRKFDQKKENKSRMSKETDNTEEKA